MANNSKKSKQTESKQKSLFNNASDQQENQPKRGIIIKPDHNDSILMSKRLMQKRSSSRTRRHKRKTTSTYRIFPNAKPMPSLADLEKMFEDSDDDMKDNKSTDAKQQPAHKSSAQTSSNKTETLMIPKVMVTDLLLSPTKGNRIEDEAKEKFNNSSSSSDDVIEITSPSRKRIKTHELYDECDESDELPPVNISPKKVRKTNSVTVDNIMSQNEHTQSMIPVDSEENIVELILDENDNSLNKLQSTSTSEAFSPIPSTSQSIEVLNRNENLLEIVTENNNLTKEQPLKQQIPIIHNATIVIEDEAVEHPPTDAKTEINHNFETTETTIQITPTGAADTNNSQDSCEDDDDCIIVETSCSIINNTTREPNNMDIEVINTECERTSNFTEHAHNETIDVDALIAQNLSIIDRYNYYTTTNPLNVLIDVDLLSIADNTDNPSGHTTNNSQPQLNETPEQVTTSINMQVQPSNDHDVENIRTNNTRNDSNMHSCPNTERHMSNESYRWAIQRIYDSYTTSSLNRTQYPTSSSYRTSYPRTSSLRGQYSAAVAAIVKRRRAQAMRQCAHNTSMSKERPSTSGDAGDCHSNLIPSLGDCPICMDNLSGKVIGSTVCGHVFCMSCLQKAVRTTRRCPTCRKQLKYNGYHKLYL